MTVEDDVKALREEIGKLRERIAVLEATRQTPLPLPHIDWSRPVHVGTPMWLGPHQYPPGTIYATSGLPNG